MAKQPPVTACGDSPNCVSTEDRRAKYQLAPLSLASTDIAFTTIVEKIAAMPRAEVVSAQDNYAHLRFTTRVLRFVDDVEVSLSDNQLALRSASRIGYYDFGANRRRADAIRRTLVEAKLVRPSGDH
ncbi:DUF1499 domain-containing protein [Salinivibrio kushneri]|uniref:DUF1499 domain-containing protein n=1 Tax=Salinivibrio kushneri TaxID=1908198 RepID=A0AA47KLS1_9GAMM|nr:DUF1499 domain-containing protein [Salinivibrio kushneri]WBA09320.1 DUF1499 domain-containing protein [Salinivibrio kushneri]